nr:non-structural maintenance of chromosomes element 4 homolog A [Tanacetum cinerariifolium]
MEQVVNAEALLDITNTLGTSIKAQSNEGVSARDFGSSLLKGFGRLGDRNDGTDGSRNAQSNEDVTAGDFGSSLLRGFGRLGDGNDGTNGSRNVVKWKKLRIVDPPMLLVLRNEVDVARSALAQVNAIIVEMEAMNDPFDFRILQCYCKLQDPPMLL